MEFFTLFFILFAAVFTIVIVAALVKDADDMLGCGGWLVAIVVICLVIVVIQSC